jgi:hypothetical protein
MNNLVIPVESLENKKALSVNPEECVVIKNYGG